MQFSELNGKTTIHLEGQPLKANNDELSGFTGLQESMQEGFSGTFDQLSAYLEKQLS